MNKKKIKRNKLSLNRETVRRLGAKELSGVGGGEYVASNVNSCGELKCIPSVNQCVNYTPFTCMTNCNCSMLICGVSGGLFDCIW